MFKLLIFTLFFLLVFRALPSFASDIKIGLIYSREEGQKLLKGEDGLKHYREAIQIAGGRVVVLSQDYDEEFLMTQLNQIGGLLVPGGIDIDPSMYGEEMNGTSPETDISYDRFEFRIIEYCIGKKIPILGICRGHQLLNIYHGGNLYQHLPDQYEAENKLTHQVLEDGKIKPLFHYINIDKASLLYEILREESIRVNTTHHQAVRKVAPGFKVVATAPDGVIEGLEYIGENKILSVQFHPERLILEDPRFDDLFKWLVREAGK